ncbi:DUF2252 domain-containing protein [Rhodovarius crocodyli]|uniref:DUF2252 domain-containing protein n=2 Tax=Rhodovarius crocodyli TaxID=1979269 RepID=A0A437MK02_9PROT|nr:DUF2252 domain-containing protein [Rhodovarius crocodyli]
MRAAPFAFLRATYWRWAEIIPTLCPELMGAPPVLAVGDVHLENFGTWRDDEGRLVWGVNDFDEAAVMPWPLDLLRLAVSALLAGGGRESCDAILSGFLDGAEAPCPIVLERDWKWLRKAVLVPEEDRAAFWAKFEALPAAPALPAHEQALLAVLPAGHGVPVFSPRTAGTGSLGRPRFVARADWRGGLVLRESKALVPSGWNLAQAPTDDAISAQAVATGRFRAPDPYYRQIGAIITRRLSPNSRKIEVKDSASQLLEARMLAAMGREIANCQAGDAERWPGVREEAKRMAKGWLHKAAEAAAEAVVKEQKEFAAG